MASLGRFWFAGHFQIARFGRGWFHGSEWVHQPEFMISTQTHTDEGVVEDAVKSPK
jgi:hypothetical protein